MIVKKSSTEKSLIKYVNSGPIKPSLKLDPINRYYCLPELYRESKPEVLNKMPGFNNVGNRLQVTPSGYGKLQGYQSSASVKSKQILMSWWQSSKEQRNGQKFIKV